MPHIRSIISKGASILAIAFIMASPLGVTLTNVSADGSDTGCKVPKSSDYGPGVHVPTGAEAAAFVYQCPDANNPNKPHAGEWLSQYYVFDPVTDTESPLAPITYTCNPATGKYDYTAEEWVPASKSYQPQNGSTAKPPANGNVINCPTPTTTPSPTGGSSGATASLAAVQPNVAAPAGGSNTATTFDTNTGTVTNNTGATVTNNIGSLATSGDAKVINTVNGGNATTGNAVTQANVINMLQSSSNAIGSGTNVATFTYNVDGDVNGDLLFDPSQIVGVQGDTSSTNNLNNNLLINNTSDATINNNLTLGSISGDATVADDVNGGNATTGNATTIANIVNSIESSIVAGKSFIGTININGNLNGNILIPANFVDTLIADNQPTVVVAKPNSTSTANSTTSNKTTVTNTNNQGIFNQVTSTANSGKAIVKDDYSAGSATSGEATTNVTAFNLTGSNVVAQNDILVFVNVVGKWTGLIVNAPPGVTAAEIGGNVTENNTVKNNTTLNNTTNQQINNTVNVSANSGDAKVKDDYTGGNATTGDAKTAVNLANVEDSTLNISNWFGILFINVFGTWNGSFGMNASAGGTAAGANGSGNTYLVGTVAKLVHYAPVATSSSSSTPSYTTSVSQPTSTSGGTVLADHTTKATLAKAAAPQLQENGHRNWTLTIIGVVLAAGLFASSERWFGRRR